MIQFLWDGILYLVVPILVVSCLAAGGSNSAAESDEDDEEQARAWHANSVNPDSPNYRFK